MGWEGIEPSTPDLKGRYSTTELPAHAVGRLVRAKGFEPPTIGLEIRRSIQLSYARTRVGAEEGDRTNTSFRKQDFKSRASASSATSALIWWAHLDLNQGPDDYEPPALNR